MKTFFSLKTYIRCVFDPTVKFREGNLDFFLLSAAYFYASHQKAADKNGFRLRDESGSGEVIRRYRKEGITLTLPDGKNLNNIKIFYLWCEEFDVSIHPTRDYFIKC